MPAHSALKTALVEILAVAGALGFGLFGVGQIWPVNPEPAPPPIIRVTSDTLPIELRGLPVPEGFGLVPASQTQLREGGFTLDEVELRGSDDPNGTGAYYADELAKTGWSRVSLEREDATNKSTQLFDRGIVGEVQIQVVVSQDLAGTLVKLSLARR